MNSVTKIFNFSMGMMNRFVLLIIGIALLGFLWGVLKYLKSYDNAKERSASVKYIVYGLLSLLVITSLWGFVYLLGDSFGINLNSNNGDFINNINGGTDSNILGDNPIDVQNDIDVPPVSITDPTATRNFWENVSNMFGN